MKETLGQYLKREREARNVSLNELSKATRINETFLEALEKDDLSLFAQREFIIGFLKCYTRYLGLTPDEALKRYIRQAELESRKVDFCQLSLFPDFAGNQKEREIELLNQNNCASGKKIPKWVYIQGAITLIALAVSFYIQQILKQTDYTSRTWRNDSLPSLYSPSFKGRNAAKEEVGLYLPEKTNPEKKAGNAAGNG